MSTFAIDRSGRAQTAMVALATLMALGVLVVVLARWTWAWFGPPVEARAVATIPAGGRSEQTRQLFGTAAPAGAVATPTGLAVTLLGIVAAADGRQGYALMRFEGQPSLVAREGDEVAPGIRLVQVAADHIVLERAGTRERLALPKPTGAATAAVIP